MMRMDLSHLHWIERESPFSEILSIKFSLNGVSYLCIFTLGTYDESSAILCLFNSATRVADSSVWSYLAFSTVPVSPSDLLIHLFCQPTRVLTLIPSP